MISGYKSWYKNEDHHDNDQSVANHFDDEDRYKRFSKESDSNRNNSSIDDILWHTLMF